MIVGGAGISAEIPGCDGLRLHLDEVELASLLTLSKKRVALG